MKHSTLKNIALFINILLGFSIVFFGLPFWSIALLFPANLYCQIYFTQQYSFRNSLQLEEVSQTGNQNRISELNQNEQSLEDLGFNKFDEFYMRTSSDIIVFAYKHVELPIVLCQYHLGAYKTIDLMTSYENDYALTTTNIKSTGISTLRPLNYFLQIFTESGAEELFRRHIQSMEFLKAEEFAVTDKPLYNFRNEFLRKFLEAGKMYKSLISPVQLLYLNYFGDKYKFAKTIQEQVLAKQLQLP